MVESNQTKANSANYQEAKPILKNQLGATGEDNHVHFDEVEIAEYDKTRGQCMKIDDPKTPYHDSSEDEEMTKELAPGEDADPETLKHLEEAQENRNLNAK